MLTNRQEEKTLIDNRHSLNIKKLHNETFSLNDIFLIGQEKTFGSDKSPVAHLVFNLNIPFLNYIQFPVIDTYYYESKYFNNNPQNVIFSIMKPDEQDADAKGCWPGLIVEPKNSIDLFSNSLFCIESSVIFALSRYIPPADTFTLVLFTDVFTSVVNKFCNA